jgi:hypothetical protein
MPGTGFNILLLHAIEEEDNFHMRKILDMLEGFFAQWIKEFDDGYYMTPIVVSDSFACVPYHSDGRQADHMVLFSYSLFH